MTSLKAIFLLLIARRVKGRDRESSNQGMTLDPNWSQWSSTTPMSSSEDPGEEKSCTSFFGIGALQNLLHTWCTPPWSEKHLMTSLHLCKVMWWPQSIPSQFKVAFFLSTFQRCVNRLLRGCITNSVSHTLRKVILIMLHKEKMCKYLMLR